MKMRKIYRTLLALVLAFSLTVPAIAAEGETVPPAPPVTEEQVPETPEEAVEPSEDGEQATEPSVPPGVPEDPNEADQPEPPEAPENPETPADPEAPSVPDAPEPPETPPVTEVPETPENPTAPPAEDPALPPAWLLPPEQLPVEQAPPVEAPQAEPPIINVIVPDAGAVIINPYGLPVEIDGRETTEQIAGSTMLLENRSNVAVDVSVSAAGTPQGGVIFAAQPPARDALEKAVFLYAEFQATEYFGQTVPWQDFFSDSPNQLLVTPCGSAKDGLLLLEALGLPYSWGAVRLFGSAAACPVQPWEAGDGFHVNLAFTFTPVIPETPVPDTPSGADFDSTLVLPSAPAAVPEPITPAVPDEPAAPPEQNAGGGVDALLLEPPAPAVEDVREETERA